VQSSYGLSIQDSESLLQAYKIQKEQIGSRIPKFLVKVHKKPQKSSLLDSESVVLEKEMAHSEAVIVEKEDPALRNSESILKEALAQEAEEEHKRSLANAL